MTNPIPLEHIIGLVGIGLGGIICAIIVVIMFWQFFFK